MFVLVLTVLKGGHLSSVTFGMFCMKHTSFVHSKAGDVNIEKRRDFYYVD